MPTITLESFTDKEIIDAALALDSRTQPVNELRVIADAIILAQGKLALSEGLRDTLFHMIVRRGGRPIIREPRE